MDEIINGYAEYLYEKSGGMDNDNDYDIMDINEIIENDDSLLEINESNEKLILENNLPLNKISLSNLKKDQIFIKTNNNPGVKVKKLSGNVIIKKSDIKEKKGKLSGNIIISGTPSFHNSTETLVDFINNL